MPTDVTRPIRTLAAVLLALVTGACTSGTPAEPTTAPPTSPAGAVLPDLQIAFVENLAPDGAAQRVAPAFQGARLAVDAAALRGAIEAGVRVVPFNTAGTPEGIAAVAEQIAADPTIVAAIVAPQLTGQIALGDRLDAAGVPTISLSTLGPELPEQGWTDWRRAVPDIDHEAAALVSALRRVTGERRACLLSDGSAASVALIRAVARAMPRRPALRQGLAETVPDDPSVVAAVEGAACRSIVWGGTPTGAALLRVALVENGLREVRIFGGESLKDASYITTAGPRGRGTIAVCPCADLSTSTDLRAQRFIQDYQSAFGVPPGPFAAEAWDVARMVLDTISAGATTPGEVAAELGRTRTFAGLARDYAFARNGALEDQASGVRVYRDEGVRWVADDRPASAAG
jgi:ABC-type branched-subunit amino acid transport system substrate-binding protein